jgi:hypothetical protein
MRIVRHPVSEPSDNSVSAPSDAQVTSIASPVTIAKDDLSVAWHGVPAVTGFTVAAGDGEIMVTADHAREFHPRFGAVVQIRVAGAETWQSVKYDLQSEFSALVIAGVTNGVSYEVRAAWGDGQAHGPWAYANPLVPIGPDAG